MQWLITNQMDLVSSIVMLITSRLAAKPNIRKFPVVHIIPFYSIISVLTFCRGASVLRQWGLFFSAR